MKSAVLVSGMMVCCFSSAWANPGLMLNWNDCPASVASQTSLIAACRSGGEQQLVASLELAAPVDSVIALEAVIDVQTTGAALPAWWQYGPSGCRGGRLTASANFSGMAACADFWQGTATFPGAPVYSAGAPRGAAYTARIVVSFAVLSSESRALVANTPYYAARLVFSNDVGDDCLGCDVPACLLLNSIRLVRLPGAVGGDVEITTPAGTNSNRAIWQSTVASCDAVPVRRISWGSIKQLYR